MVVEHKNSVVMGTLKIKLLNFANGVEYYLVANKEDGLHLFTFTKSQDKGIVLEHINHVVLAKKHIAVFRKELVEKVIPLVTPNSFVAVTYKMGNLGTLRVVGAILSDLYFFADAQKKLLSRTSKEANDTHIYCGTFGNSPIKNPFTNVDTLGVNRNTIKAGSVAIQQGQVKTFKQDFVRQQPNYVGGFVLSVTTKIDLSDTDFETYVGLRS